MNVQDQASVPDDRRTAETVDELPPLAGRPSDLSLNDLLHDLRSPLSAIATWVDMLRDSDLPEAQRRDGLEIISLSVQEMTALLNRWAALPGSRSRLAHDTTQRE